MKLKTIFNKSNLAKVLVGVALLVSANVNATLLGCFDCSAYQSKIAAVNEFKASRATEAFLEVVDFKNNIVYSYNVEYDAESRQTFVMVASNSSNARNTASNLTTQYRALQTAADNVNYESNLASSAFDVITNNQHATVANDYMHQSNLFEKIGVYGGVVLNAIGKVVVNVNIVVDIRFTDGSIIRLKVSGIDSAGQVEFEILTATDAEGNPIPLTVKAINGTYVFTSQNSSDKFGRFVRERYGITIADWASIWDMNSTTLYPKVTITDCQEGKCVDPN